MRVQKAGLMVSGVPYDGGMNFSRGASGYCPLELRLRKRIRKVFDAKSKVNNWFHSVNFTGGISSSFRISL